MWGGVFFFLGGVRWRGGHLSVLGVNSLAACEASCLVLFGVEQWRSRLKASLLVLDEPIYFLGFFRVTKEFQ